MANIFRGKLVGLRAVEPSDWEIVHRWNQADTEGLRLSDSIPFPQSSVTVQAWVDQASRRSPENDSFTFHIETLDGVLVGAINTWNTDPRAGMFWYGLRIMPEHRRKGYASEAICLVLRYYFHERRYHKCISPVVVINEPSVRLHERLGFKLEGRITSVDYTGGAFHDVLMFGMTCEEFDALGWQFDD